MTRPLLILGAGGHAAVLIEAARLEGRWDPVGVLDADPGLWGGDVLGVPVLGGDDRLTEAGGLRGAAGCVGVGFTDRPDLRIRLFERLRACGMDGATIVHPAAVVSPSATLGPGTVVMAGAIVNARARLGANVILNTGAIVDHDSEVGDHSHVATGARLAGGVRAGRGVLVGAGATVRHGARIGDFARVGLGAAVVRDVPAGATVVGVPARRLEGER